MNENGARSREAFEPVDPREVEMVGRLIHQQEIRLLDEMAADGQALPPASRECRNERRAVDEPEAAEHLARPNRLLVGL